MNRLLKTPKPDVYKIGMLRFKYESKKKMPMEDIEAEAQKVSNALRKKFKDENMAVKIVLRYEDMWYSNPKTRAGHDIIVDDRETQYNEEDIQRDFNRFDIYAIKNAIAEKKGGADKYNDCLYNVLEKVLVTLPWTHPAKLKKFLELERKDKIPVTDIAKIERKMSNVKINVRGDDSHISTKVAPFEINIKLKNGHYSLDASKHKQFKGIAHFSHKERIPCMVYNNFGEKKSVIYDPEKKEERPISQDEFTDIRKNPMSSEFAIVPVNKMKNNKKKTLKQFYDEFVHLADILKTECWRLNLYKTGTTKDTALKLFFDLSKHIYVDPIEQHEAEWIDRASIGGIIFADEYKGAVYSYDFVSRYPSIMKSGMLFAIKKGEFTEMKELPKVLTYGVYRCKITGDINKKLFKVNPIDYYTHIDIYRARELKYKIELIHDSEPNALLYTRDKLITGHELFGKYVSILFPMKVKYSLTDKQVCAVVKLIMNTLWGALCEKNRLEDRVTTQTEKAKYPNWDIVDIKPIGDETVIYFDCHEVPFKTPYARLKPFMLAKGRACISKAMEPYIKNIVRVQTDGFLATKKLPIKTSEELGGLKYEGYCDSAIIIHVNEITNRDGNKLKDVLKK